MPRLIRLLKLCLISLAVIAAIAAMVGLTLYIAHRAGYGTSSPGQACDVEHRSTHRVTIQNNSVTPVHTTAARCDRLTVTNLDNTNRLMAFGRHDEHTPYDGIEERLLAHGQSLTVTLVDTGKFKFHDHLHDEIQGTFTVNE